jgi:hypothetical protein
MKKYSIIIAFFVFSATACFASPYPLLNPDSSKALLECTDRISMGFGYDSDIEIYGIFSYNVEKQTTPSKINPQAEVNRYMDGLPIETVKDLYFSLAANSAAAEYLSQYYKKKKVWRFTNFLNNKIIPGNQLFMSYLTQYIQTNSRCANFASDAKALNDSKIKAVLSQKNRLTITDDYQ